MLSLMNLNVALPSNGGFWGGGLKWQKVAHGLTGGDGGGGGTARYGCGFDEFPHQSLVTRYGRSLFYT